MPDEKIQYEVHDYDPLNKYIDERSRIKRTRSVWGYTRSLALFLIALGIFLILAAYAYHIFKKPHPQNLLAEDNIKTESYMAEKGQRLFQLVATDSSPIYYELVDEIGVTTRGTGGFGSTGK